MTTTRETRVNQLQLNPSAPDPVGHVFAAFASRDRENAKDDQIAKMSVVCAWACVGCLIAAALCLAGAIVLPFYLDLMHNAVYWLGLAMEGMSVLFIGVYFWIKNNIFGG